MSDCAKNRILLISYHFPPSAAIGGTRVANFAKWLPSFGWEARILTIQDRDVEQFDTERLHDVEGTTIYKAGVWPTLAALYGSVKGRLFGSRGITEETVRPPGESAGPASVRRESFAERLRRYALSFLSLPDFERGWIVPAMIAAVRRVRRDRIGWIMTSCPPYSVHLVGLGVKGITGARWVADFRDPWMTTGSKRSYATCALSIRLESWLERKVIERADLLLFGVERLKEAYRQRYAHVPGEKFVFLPNGIAPRALEAAAPAAKYERFTLSYTGSIYVRRSPEPVFQAISRLVQEGRISIEDVCIKLVGQCRTVEGVPTALLARKYGLERVVEIHDPRPSSEAQEIIRRSHLALLFAPHLPYQIPAKAYDYLAAGARILAIAEDGGTADLVRSTDSGETFRSEDVDGIKDFIHREMTRRGSPSPIRVAGLGRFDARRITEELAGRLDRISATGSADAPAPADAPHS